jgi:hypothetical protein
MLFQMMSETSTSRVLEGKSSQGVETRLRPYDSHCVLVCQYSHVTLTPFILGAVTAPPPTNQ